MRSEGFRFFRNCLEASDGRLRGSDCCPARNRIALEKVKNIEPL